MIQLWLIPLDKLSSIHQSYKGPSDGLAILKSINFQLDFSQEMAMHGLIELFLGQWWFSD